MWDNTYALDHVIIASLIGDILKFQALTKIAVEYVTLLPLLLSSFLKTVTTRMTIKRWLLLLLLYQQLIKFAITLQILTGKSIWCFTGHIIIGGDVFFAFVTCAWNQLWLVLHFLFVKTWDCLM